MRVPALFTISLGFSIRRSLQRGQLYARGTVVHVQCIVTSEGWDIVNVVQYLRVKACVRSRVRREQHVANTVQR